MDFSQHDRRDKALIHYDDDKLAGIEISEGIITPLECSEQVYDAILLDERLVLGYDLIWKCYRSDFVDTGYRKAQYPYPMALWDARSGKRLVMLQGLHTGSLRGASLLDNNRLITWARDFCVKLWDIESGAPIGTYSMPIHLNEDGLAIVDSRNCDNYRAEDWKSYLTGNSAPGFTVSIILKPTPDKQEKLGPIGGPREAPSDIHRYEHSAGEHLVLTQYVSDLDGAEAGYSKSFRLEDGRYGIGGATYGAWEQVFIWDGADDLTILVPQNMDTNTEIIGEMAPRTIRIATSKGIFDFEDV